MIQQIHRSSEAYPQRLARLGNSPDVLHVSGTIPSGDAVAIVGTRHPDPRMVRFARELAGDLCVRSVAVISGGALGIDTAAHRGALDAGGCTVAVLGSGFQHPYPEENRDLFEEIALRGAVISEFPPQTPPARWTFPRRNRIVVALARAVVVVQASVRSGAMITAEIAREMGVPLGVVPGMAGDASSAGSNRLLRNGAIMVESAKDVVDLMGKDGFRSQLSLSVLRSPVDVPHRPVPVLVPADMSPNEEIVWQHLCLDPVHIDDIANRTGLPPQVVSGVLLKLELSGMIEDSGGRRFVRATGI